MNDCFLTFVVYTPNRATPYESRCYIMKRTDRQVRLEVEPPLLVSDDVKIEFFTRPRLDYVGLHPKLWRKGNKVAYFYTYLCFALQSVFNETPWTLKIVSVVERWSFSENNCTTKVQNGGCYRNVMVSRGLTAFFKDKMFCTCLV